MSRGLYKIKIYMLFYSYLFQPDTDDFVPEREGRDHMDIRFDALMPKVYTMYFMD